MALSALRYMDEKLSKRVKFYFDSFLTPECEKRKASSNPS